MQRPSRLSNLFTRRQSDGASASRRRGRLDRRRQKLSAERLEGRQMLAVTTTFAAGVLTINYDAMAGQAATIEIEDDGVHNAPATAFAANVNVYSSDTPLAQFFDGVTSVVVSVLNPTNPGVNDNSLAIKGINTGTDRIILAGSELIDPITGGRYTNVAGRWSNELPGGNQLPFTISGIDDLTVTAGGIINVSGTFVNDTNDASIHAIGTIPERAAAQHTATIVVGETTPQTGVVSEPWLFSDTVEIVGGEIDIYATINATIEVSLRAGDSAPADVRSNLVLPYDIIVTDDGTPTGTRTGRVDLFSTQNIVQLQSSKIVAKRVVAVSNNDRATAPDGPWMIDLGSVGNTFEEIALGMIAAPGDATVAATQGRIGIRNGVDLDVVDFGILASTGRVRIDTAGGLTISAPIQATGLIVHSDDSITSKPGAVMRLGGLGIELYANDTYSSASTGDIKLEGPITIKDDAAPTRIVTNKIEAAGFVTMAGGFFCPLPGSTSITSRTSAAGVLVSGPIQVGSATLNAPSTAVTVNDHTLSLIALAGDINVLRVAGNAVVPHAIQATETISFDAGGDISIAGSVYSGVMYGNPAKLTATEALPSITVKAGGEVEITSTGALRTKAYQTNPDVTTNPMVGLIQVSEASKVTNRGTIVADGAVHIGDTVDNVNGDVYLYGTTTARENIRVVAGGGIEVQGAVRSIGGTYTTVPATDDQRYPHVILTALGVTGTGGIATSGAGTITAGVINKTEFGKVLLTAQQDIDIDADINTPGAIEATTKLGAVNLSALLQANNKQPITITAGNGIYETDPDFGRIVTASLTLTNNQGVPGPSDIDLSAKNNQIGVVTATNFAVGGNILINNGPVLDIAAGGIKAVQDPTAPSRVTLASRAGIVQSGPIIANELVVSNVGAAGIDLNNAGNDVDNFAGSNPIGPVTYKDANGFETGVNRTAPLGVEVTGTAVTLASAEPFSRIRVVSGLKYNSLSIGAGPRDASVGLVEFVTTSPADNPAPAGKAPTFVGTLRDMIGYVNDNIATYTERLTTRSQPMAFVFDEDGFPVSGVSLASALPTIKRPVLFDGGMLESTVLAGGQTRIEISPLLVPNSLPYGLSFAAGVPPIAGRAPAYPGSNGSTIQHVSMFGFTRGSALVLASGGNTVTDFYAGLRADGSVDALTPNFVGLEISGKAAVGNLIGSTVFDPATVNRFGGNTSAGILVRNAAANNRIYGNVIGDETGFAPDLANGDGIRITAATGNLVGTPDQVQPDLSPSVSNVIARNKGNGILIASSIAGSADAANVLRNNVIQANRTGVSVSASRFAVLGDADNVSQNVIVGQTGDGVAISNSRDVQLFGNLIGVTPTSDAFTLPQDRNGGNGVAITGTSRTVQVAAGNQISNNKLNGVSIGTGVTGVTLSDNTIGGLLADGVTKAGNVLNGVAITASVGNTIGTGNTIADNGGHGVSLVDTRAAGLATGNRVLGSTITRNTLHGIYVSGGAASTIGGTAAGDGNLIQANLASGIVLERSAKTGAPTGFAIQGNYVGANENLDVDSLLGNTSGIVVSDGVGLRIEGNTVMNNRVNDGITLRGGSGVVIGGVSAAQGNLIANNARDGVRIEGLTATQSARGHWVTGNTIVENGTPGVVGNGVTVTGKFATGITVGQSVTSTGVRGLGNVIQRNAVNGVTVADRAQQVSIQGNSIAENGVAGISNTSTTAGISLSRATIRQPIGSQVQLLLQGQVTGATRGQQYSVDVYANDPLDSAQARRFLGRVTVTATASGTITWNATTPLRISANVVPGELITATVTDLRAGPGSTSNLSAGREATR